MVNSLAILTCYNRLAQTQVTLDSLTTTVNLAHLDLAIVDNGSTDGTPDYLRHWQSNHPGVHLDLLPENTGTSRALNLAMLRYRQAGQDVIKLDNDVRFLNAGWRHGVQRFFEHTRATGRKVAMVTAYYPEMFTHKHVICKEVWEWHNIIHYYPSVGCATWYTAEFIEKTGYFDVLSPKHVYGFEDLIIAAKAKVLDWEICAWQGWKIEHLHCASSLGEARAAEVAQMRPLYEQRLWALQLGGPVYTAPTGNPDRGDHRHGIEVSGSRESPERTPGQSGNVAMLRRSD